jgi:hypothetical protein
MSQYDDDAVDASNSAPDLQILGDEVTLQPSGFVEDPKLPRDDREEALMDKFASFRSEPLQYVTSPFSYIFTFTNSSCLPGSFAKSPFMSPAKDGEPTIE